MHPSESVVALSTDQREELTKLITAAFLRAHDRKKPDWTLMTTAVLKNRLLDGTNGTFDEKHFGALRFVELIQALPELLDVDQTVQPPLVRFLPTPGGAAVSSAATPTTGRIRDDLWSAVFDYSSGGTYVWRDDSAVWVLEPEPSDLILPTVTPAELDNWRATFVSENGGGSTLEAWAKKGLSTAALPPSERPLWNSLLQERARQRLEEWFQEHGQTSPSDMTSVIAAHRKDEEVDRLRRYLQRCVATMTAQELRTLMIPATAAARLTR